MLALNLRRAVVFIPGKVQAVYYGCETPYQYYTRRLRKAQNSLTTESSFRPSSSSCRTCQANVAGKAEPEDSMIMRSGEYFSVECLSAQLAGVHGTHLPLISSRAVRIWPTRLIRSGVNELELGRSYQRPYTQHMHPSVGYRTKGQ